MKIEKSKRKSGKDLRNEYQDLLDKTTALHIRIIKRAEELIDRYPNVEIISSTNSKITVSQYKKHCLLEIRCAINCIEKIEEYIESLQPYKQGKFNF